MLSEKDFLEYAEEKGDEMAADMLLFLGPDSFNGTYDEYMSLYAKLMRGVVC